MLGYHNLMRRALLEGVLIPNRTGTNAYTIIGPSLTFSVEKVFPLVTSKRIYWKGVVLELLWFISGDTNAKTLQKNAVHIWDEWANEDGELGPIYGKQWREWGPSKLDQLEMLINGLTSDPYGRRHILTSWNPDEIHECALPPCHCFVQFHVVPDRFDRSGKKILHCQLYQRSADIFLGLPFNIASYSLLLSMIAQVTGHKPGRLYMNLGNAHLYENHIEQAKKQLSRKILPFPKLQLNEKVEKIDDFKVEDIQLLGYDPHPAIDAPVAV